MVFPSPSAALVIRMTFGGAELRDSNRAVRRLRRDSEKAVLDAIRSLQARSAGRDRYSVRQSFGTFWGESSDPRRQPDKVALGMTPRSGVLRDRSIISMLCTRSSMLSKKSAPTEPKKRPPRNERPRYTGMLGWEGFAGTRPDRPR